MRKKENRPNNFFGSICREIGDGQNGDCIDPTSQQMFGGLLSAPSSLTCQGMILAMKLNLNFVFMCFDWF